MGRAHDSLRTSRQVLLTYQAAAESVNKPVDLKPGWGGWQPSYAAAARPRVLGLAVAHLERLALSAGYRSARYGPGLASQRLSALLDPEDPAGPARKTNRPP